MYRVKLLGLEASPVDLVQFGVLGVVLMLFLIGWAWTKPSVDQLKADKEKAETRLEKVEDQRDAMVDVYKDEFLPVLSKLTAIVKDREELAPLLSEVRTILTEAKTIIGQRS